jgi:hypothetical protein
MRVRCTSFIQRLELCLLKPGYCNQIVQFEALKHIQSTTHLRVSRGVALWPWRGEARTLDHVALVPITRSAEPESFTFTFSLFEMQFAHSAQAAEPGTTPGPPRKAEGHRTSGQPIRSHGAVHVLKPYGGAHDARSILQLHAAGDSARRSQRPPPPAAARLSADATRHRRPHAAG